MALGRERVVDLDGERVVVVPEEPHGDVVPEWNVAPEQRVEMGARAIVLGDDREENPLADRGCRVPSSGAAIG